VDANYTYLDAQDLVADAPLLRRPHHSAGLGVDWRPIPTIEIYPRLLFVGSRADVSEVVGPVTDPSYLTMDFTGRWQVTEIVAPYVRLTNAFNHAYEEAAGYPNPGRLVVGGLDVRF
jgi:outer membrane cobalamin receptor